MSSMNVHYGHLCTVRVTKFDVSQAYNGAQLASIVFQVQANKTRAYRTYHVRVPYDKTAPGTQTSTQTVRTAWKALTGQELDSGATQGLVTAGQNAVMSEIKDFVKEETEKMGVNLTLDVV